MTLAEGSVIDEVWVIEQALGTGGMGSVYRAHNQRAPRIKAAIKVLGENLKHYPEAQERFVREAEILFGLDHPHIVKVRNVRFQVDPPYIEMEFVEGRSLESLLGEGPVQLGRSLLFAEQLASALRYLHRHQVYHRDVKPANLLVRKGAMLKLVDFGLAVEVGGRRITEADTAFGTVAYAPPEWVRPSELEPRSWDLYALGVVLYEMLTGDVAFRSPSQAGPRQTAVQVMAEKQQVECLDPGPEFADDLRALVRSLTHQDQAQRPPDARHVIERLQQIQRDLHVDTTTILADALKGEDLRRAIAARAVELVGKATPASQAPARDELMALGDVPTGAIRSLEKRHSPATPVERDADPPARRRRTGIAVVGLTGAGLAGGALTLLAVALGAAAWWLGRDTTPPPRPVSVLVAGVPRDAEVVVHLGDHAPVRRDGLAMRFDPLPPGDHEVRWAAGPGCAEAPCPDDACPVWCGRGQAVLTVDPGEGRATLPLEITTPPPRELMVPVELVGSGSAQARLGALTVPVTEDGATFSDVQPGPHAVEVWVGDCTAEHRGCAGDGSCPPGCASVVAEVVVPADGQIAVDPVSLEAPEVEPPKPTPKRRQPKVVTRAAYASWLAAHPEWTREAALADGRADDSYLRGIDLGSSGAVTAVSWDAASAYCSGRGGLAALSASPTTWDEGSSGLFQEWRTDNGTPAWRRYDGATSTQLVPSQANAFTGFRCAR